jgi:hypothetical protein
MACTTTTQKVNTELLRAMGEDMGCIQTIQLFRIKLTAAIMYNVAPIKPKSTSKLKYELWWT